LESISFWDLRYCGVSCWAKEKEIKGARMKKKTENGTLVVYWGNRRFGHGLWFCDFVERRKGGTSEEIEVFI